MSFEVEGKLLVKNDEVQVTDAFRKREFVLEIEPDSRYPQTVPFELSQDRCDLLDAFAIGQIVKVEFGLRGREWTKPETGEVKYFMNLNVWDISSDEATANQEHEAAPPPPPAADDNIPF